MGADSVLGIVTLHLLEDFHVAHLLDAGLEWASLVPPLGKAEVLLNDGQTVADREDLANLIEFALVVMLVRSC